MKINIDNIEIEVTKKKIKNIYLSIDSKSGKIKLSAPKSIGDQQVMDFLLSKKDWMITNLNRLEKAPLYIQDSSIVFLGESYILNIIPYNKNKINLTNGFLNLYIKDEISKENIEKIIYKWYREELKSILKDLIYKWESTMDLKISEYRIKQMKTRWGSCNPRAKRIWFNLDLIKKNINEIEYVVVHELAHLIQSGHGKEFKNLMDNYYQDWRNIRNKLNNK